MACPDQLGPKRPLLYCETSALGAKPRAVPRPFKSSFAKRPPRHFAVVKLKCAFSKNLIIFVALSGQQYDVAHAGLVHRHANRFFAVRLDQVFSGGPLQSDDDVADDFERILRAWVVA